MHAVVFFLRARKPSREDVTRTMAENINVPLGNLK